MLFAELSRKRPRKSASRNACLTSAWQSSKVPSISSAWMFLFSVVSCFS